MWKTKEREIQGKSIHAIRSACERGILLRGRARRAPDVLQGEPLSAQVQAQVPARAQHHARVLRQPPRAADRAGNAAAAWPRLQLLHLHARSVIKSQAHNESRQPVPLLTRPNKALYMNPQHALNSHCSHWEARI
jgi:hypothetical protein